MAEQIDLNTLDRRMAERLIRSGKLSREDWEKHLQSLPDVAEKAEPIRTELETGVMQGR